MPEYLDIATDTGEHRIGGVIWVADDAIDSSSWVWSYSPGMNGYFKHPYATVAKTRARRAVFRRAHAT